MASSRHLRMTSGYRFRRRPPMQERCRLVLAMLREHGGWMTGKEAGARFPDWNWQAGYGTMQKLVAEGLVEKRLTDVVAAWGRKVPEYRAVSRLP